MEFDIVQLNKDYKGFEKGTTGIVIELQGGNCKCIFLDKNNLGDYAVAVAPQELLSTIDSLPKQFQEDIEKNKDKLTKTSFAPSDVHIYDLVEVVVQKEKYAKFGVNKGMQGVVMSEQAVMGQWQVIFSEDGTGNDIADICIDEKDFIVIKKHS